ncbi:MAG: hypothetical protein O9301_11260 [Leptospira sp.]|nr:hypothetical protein [Leptospira sp.]
MKSNWYLQMVEIYLWIRIPIQDGLLITDQQQNSGEAAPKLLVESLLGGR